MGLHVGQHWLLEVGVLGLSHLEQCLPFVVQLRPLFLEVLGVLDESEALVGVLLLESLLKGLEVNLLENRLQGVERLLQDLVPVGFSHMADDGYQQREGVGFVGLEDCQEVVIFEEAHGTISHLQVQPRNALHQPLKEFGNVGLQLLHLAGLQHLQNLSDKHYLLRGVCKGPVPEQSLQEQQSKSWVLGQE
jgi:hypothetical protein